MVDNLTAKIFHDVAVNRFFFLIIYHIYQKDDYKEEIKGEVKRGYLSGV